MKSFAALWDAEPRAQAVVGYNIETIQSIELAFDCVFTCLLVRYSHGRAGSGHQFKFETAELENGGGESSSD